MRAKRCEVCGVIMYDYDELTICDCCLDDLKELEDADSGE
jgi:hypothetical protein